MNTGAFKRGWEDTASRFAIDNDPTPPYDLKGPPPDQQAFAQTLH